MCQQIVKFCSGSMKPLLIFGGLITFTLAIYLGYLTSSTYTFFSSIDEKLGQEYRLNCYLQLAATVYLILMMVLSFFVARFEQKQAIRVLACVTFFNFILAVAASVMVFSDTKMLEIVTNKLGEMKSKYNFESSENMTDEVKNSTLAWDSIQTRGCCGLSATNKTPDEYWGKNGILPKSCCIKPELIKNANTSHCNIKTDYYEQSCINIINSTQLNLLIVLALIAIVNLYLAQVSGISAYKTFHYSEASQNPYN